MKNKKREIIIGAGNFSKINKIKQSLSKENVTVIGINEISDIKIHLDETC